MKKIMKRFSALMLSVAMAMTMMPATAWAAADNADDESSQTVDIDVDSAVESATGDTAEADVKDDAYEALAQIITTESDTEIDEDDPVIASVQAELESATVLADDGSSVALTDEQIATVTNLFQQYVNQWRDNADTLGVQVPYYLQFNDDEDSLGQLGEMLVLAGYSVDDVRSGAYTYDELLGLVMNFYFGDTFGLQYFGDDIVSARNEALNQVEESGATTEAQKLLVLNDYLSQTTNFDMAYIMGQGTSDMTAPDDDEYQGLTEDQYNAIFNTIYDQYYDGIYDMFYQQIYAGTKQNLYDQYYDATKEALVDQYYGEDAADAYAASAAENYVEQAETDGVEVDPENAPGYTMTIDDMVKTVMDEEQDSLSYLLYLGYSKATYNNLADYYTCQAATGLTDGIIGYWQGSIYGAFGQGKCVCMGYAKAYAYLVQCMHPEIYTTDGDIDNASSWKTPEELYYTDGELDVSKCENGYCVDLVRITFQSDVTMYGEVEPNFNTDHFWNAVQVNGEWYYIDPCYTDVYTEVMSRDRVETDGQSNHMYFMISDTSTREMFDGYYKELVSLYSTTTANGKSDIDNEYAATDQSYEGSWFSRINCDVSYDGEYFYYVYDSTDLIKTITSHRQSSSSFDYESYLEMTDNPTICVVRHSVNADDLAESTGDDESTYGADSNFEVLVELSNYTDTDEDGSKDDNEPYACLVNGTENTDLSAAYNRFIENKENYPSIDITGSYYDGAFYFNADNAIFKYDLDSKTVSCVKQYGDVTGYRDTTNRFGGMAFYTSKPSTTDSQYNISVNDAPIGGMVIKYDGTMCVSIATNYAYISGKDPYDMDDSSSYGYEWQESDYNNDYSTYADEEDMKQYESYGFDMSSMVSNNDNDEFMWTANIEDVSTDFASKSTTYKEPECDHKYILFDQTYYKKDDYGNPYYGSEWVCIYCGKHVEATWGKIDKSQLSDYSSQYDFDLSKYGYVIDTYYDDAAAAGSASIYTDDGSWNGDVYTVTKLTSDEKIPDGYDFSQDPSAVQNVTLATPFASAGVPEIVSGSCDGDTPITYKYVVDTYTAQGYHVEAESAETATLEAGQHLYVDETTYNELKDIDTDEEEGEWTWSDDYSEATISSDDLICLCCGKTATDALGSTQTVTETAAASGTVGTQTCTKEQSTYYVTDEASLGTSDEAVTADTLDAEPAETVETAETTETIETAEVSENEEITDTAAAEDAAAAESTDVIGIAAKTTGTADSGVKGHDWSLSSWDWADDGSQATANLTCANCGKTMKANGTLTESEASKSTCTTDSTKTITATAKVPGNSAEETSATTTSDSKTVVVSQASGHSYVYSWTDWADDYSTVKLVQTCANCGESNVVATVKTTKNEQDTTASCESVAIVHKGEYTDAQGTRYWTSKTVSAAGTAEHTYTTNDVCDVCGTPKAVKISNIANNETGIGFYISQVKGADEYMVLRRAQGTTTKELIADLKADEISFKSGKAFYNDETAENATTYAYYVVTSATKNGTVKTAVSKSATKRRINQSALVSVSNTADGVKVKWSKVAGVTGYKVYSSSDNGKNWTMVGTVKGAKTVTFTDTKAKNGKTYIYKVRGYYKTSKSTYYAAYSDTLNIIRLTSPVISSASNTAAGKMTVKLKAANKSAAGYQISYSTSKSFGSDKKVTTTAVSKAISGLTKGKTYYVRVRSYAKVSGKTCYSAWSDTVKVKISK